MKRLIKCDPRIIQKKNELLEPPVIVRVNEFTESSAKTFAEDMQRAHEAGQPIIPVVIDSYGGMVDSLIAMVSEIESASGRRFHSFGESKTLVTSSLIYFSRSRKRCNTFILTRLRETEFAERPLSF